MGKWSSVLKWVSTPFVHPQRTLSGAGKAVKTATIGAGVGYVGWEALVNDKPVVQTVGDTLLGEETNAAVKDTVHGTVSAVGDTIGAAKDAIGGVTDAVNNVNTASSSWGGVGAFMKDITSGNGTNMFGNLFSNIFSGKVSMMSMLGLVASALLIFGRFGWLGKIAGALLGMLLIGNNSRVVQQQPQQRQNDLKQDGVNEDKEREKQQQKQEAEKEQEEHRPVIRR